MSYLLPLILSFSFALIPWGVKRIDKKLAEGDYPTAENREDKEPRLASLIAEAKENPSYLKVMKKIAENRKIWWEQRQDAVLYLGLHLKQKSVTKVLATIVANAEEEYVLRETAYKVLSPVTMARKLKIKFIGGFAQVEDSAGKIHLRIAKDLVELGQKKNAKEILNKLLERTTLDPSLKTDAEEFLKFLN